MNFIQNRRIAIQLLNCTFLLEFLNSIKTSERNEKANKLETPKKKKNYAAHKNIQIDTNATLHKNK